MPTTSASVDFDHRYQSHLKHLKLKGLQPKTIDAYARTIRRMGDYFDHRIDELSPEQLTHYFSDLIASKTCLGSGLAKRHFRSFILDMAGKNLPGVTH